MFVTANARGTPLTNFDILRGLVLSRFQQLTGKENSQRLNEIFSQCDSNINKICIDLDKIEERNQMTNGIISDALISHIGIKITKAGAMGHLENVINKINDSDELILFSDYFNKFFHWYSFNVSAIQNNLFYQGTSVYSQIKYAQGKEHQSFVLLILSWIMGWKPEYKTALMNVVRTFYIRNGYMYNFWQ